jgi:hypothetical protein
MIGNPYASPVDLGTVIFNAKAAGNIAGSAFYIWNPTLGAAGQFQAMMIPTLSASPYYIQGNCAFQVRAAHNNDTLNFTESNKGASATTSLLKAQPDFTSLAIYDENYHPWDMLYLQFNDAAGNDDDNVNDASKLLSPDFGFYTLATGDKKLSIDVRPFLEGSAVPLGLHCDYAKEFIIKAESVALPASGTLYLHDKMLKQYVMLQQGTEYRFAVTADKATQGDKRFELSMSPGKVAVQGKGLQMSLMPNPATDDVNITFSAAGKDEVSLRILDLTGVSVLNQNLGMQQSGGVNVPLSHLAAGVYIVELTSGSEKVVQRLVKD